MANTSAQKHVFTFSNRPAVAVASLLLAAVAACSDGVVAPEARKDTSPVPESTTAPTQSTGTETSSTGTASTGTGTAPATTPPAAPAPAPAPAPTPAPVTSGSPFAGASFYVNPNSSARQTATAWRTTRPADAAQMDKIATQSVATWLGGWYSDIAASVNALTSTMTAAGAMPVFVAYNIPQRDCGGLSGGGGSTAAAYRAWIDGVAAGIGARRAAVILEPDALAAMGCLSAADQQNRLDLLKYAVAKLRSQPQVAVYLDGGHSSWQSAATMADRLRRAGVDGANGFALNVSNFFANGPLTTYGQAISSLLGGKHFVIDTSRNGLGPTADNQWCNPPGRAIGARPSAVTGNELIDAYLWLKVPGESDGACNGFPNSGVWMPEYALGLAQRG